MFKADWEKISARHRLPLDIVNQMVGLAYPNKKLITHELITGGCANLNIKILLEYERHPLILRVYLRDKNAAYREQKLGELLKQDIPVPITYYIGSIHGYQFAITEFIPGILLRDLLLSDTHHDMGTLMYEVGIILTKITAYQFLKSGFFDKDLNITEELTDNFPLTLAKKYLQNQQVTSMLGTEIILKITNCLDKYGDLFPHKDEKHLVHGDFDPANILVEQTNGVWKVSGILDWEFAFSGSTLCDVASMLRYAHKMPPEFKDAFVSGLTSGGIILPENWRISIHLLNLLSLLEILRRSDHQNSPNQSNDIRELIKYILSE